MKRERIHIALDGATVSVAGNGIVSSAFPEMTAVITTTTTTTTITPVGV